MVTSFPEQAIYYYVHKYYEDTENSNRNILEGLELDIYIPSIKVGIEYDGYKWHENSKEKDFIKNEKCLKKGIRLIRIREKGLVSFDNCECIFRDDTINNNSLANCIYKLLSYLKIENPKIDIDDDRYFIMEQYLKVKREDTLEKLFPELVDEWHPNKNGMIKPCHIMPMSNVKIWWLGKCGHEWQASPNNRTRLKSGCPYCSIPPVLLMKGFNDLKTKNPELALEWNYEMNKPLRPEEVFPGSTKKVWWLGKCGHEWQATIGSRVNGRKCPFCTNEKLLVGFNDLKTKVPTIAEEWDYEKNKPLKPEGVFPGTTKKVWWLGKCGHEWQATIASRVSGGNGCPICAKNGIKQIINLDTGKVYKSMAEASRDTGVNKPDICRCCKGDRHTAGGYHWEYLR